MINKTKYIGKPFATNGNRNHIEEVVTTSEESTGKEEDV